MNDTLKLWFYWALATVLSSVYIEILWKVFWSRLIYGICIAIATSFVVFNFYLAADFLLDIAAKVW